MKSLIAVGFVFMASLLQGGQDYAKSEALTRDVIKTFQDLTEVLDSITDKESAKSAAAEIDKISDRFEEWIKAAEKLPRLKKEDEDKLTKQFEAEQKNMMTKMAMTAAKAGKNSGGEPTFLASMTRLGGIAGKLQALGARAGEPQPDLRPAFGSVKLKAGFEPDPVTKEVKAGGDLKTTKANVAAFISREPSYILEYEAGQFVLTIHAESKADTTLLIQLPDGTWAANDDRERGNLNPLLKFDTPQSGRYVIWVGTFGSEPAPAVLNITEKKVGR
jgi:hypothetical protein